jgi:hypothetical protein
MTLGTSKKKHDYTADLVTVHDPTGRTVGMLNPDRAQLLYHNYQETLTRTPDLATSLQAKTFPEELAHLLQRYKQGTKVPDSKRNVNLQNHLGNPPEIYQTIQNHIPGLTQERYASPLNYHPAMTRYWSCFERDQLFGAHHDAYSSQWTGLSGSQP